MMKIGILGGTFDPLHKVHLELAENALEQYGLDVVLFVPTGLPVRKLGKTHAGAGHRLDMLNAACSGIAGFEVSSLEVDRPQVTYTIDTLRELKEQYGEGSQLFLILGEDAALDLVTWKEADAIAQLATVLFARRPGIEDSSALPEGFACFEVQMPESSLSSSSIRELLHEGKDVSNSVPAEVLAYIQEHGLYGQLERNIY